jgi:oligopeptide transport system permease protein
MTASRFKFFKSRLLVICSGFLLLLSGMALFAPLVTTHQYDAQNIERKLEGPSRDHPMGTDTLGRDLYSRVVYGARMSLSVGVLTALLSLSLGTFLGSLAGSRGGWVDLTLMRVVDLFTIFPSILTAILLTLILGRGFMGILLALVLTSWVGHARLVRNLVVREKGLPYIESARAMGVSEWRVITQHILPNCIGPMIVSLTFQIPSTIMSESFLSFIGLGLQPPLSSWGLLANEGFRAMKSFPHLILFPGFTLFLTLMALQIMGEGVRKLYFPRGSRVLLG